MSIRVGTIMLGNVQASENESIQTKFFVLIAPLFPVGSYFVGNDGKAVKVKLNLGSVLAGYIRFYCGIGAGICLVLGPITWFRKVNPNPQAGMIMVGLGLVCLTLLILSLKVMGKPKPMEVRDRMILKDVLGLGVHPSYLKKKELGFFSGAIREILTEASLPTDCDELFALEPEPDQVPLVYVASLYGQVAEPDKDWARTANSIKKSV